MNILITHGYLLTGTGSNLYVNNVAREMCKAGMLCIWFVRIVNLKILIISGMYMFLMKRILVNRYFWQAIALKYIDFYNV